MYEDKVVIARPFVKSLGGKTGLLPEILARLPASFRTYHEPFVGGGALFWALAPRLREGAILSDLSEPLARTYEAVRSDPDGVIARLRGMRADQRTYYLVRELGFDAADDADVAARYIYINKAGFNGLMRFNQSGRLNTPWGHNPTRVVCDEPGIRAASAALNAVGVGIGCRPFEAACELAREGDLVYCDPPYAPLNEGSFTRYQSGDFGRGDHVRLRDAAVALKRRGVHVVLSNSDTPLVRELYAGFEVEVVHAKRAINSKAIGRGPVKELLIT